MLRPGVYKCRSGHSWTVEARPITTADAVAVSTAFQQVAADTAPMFTASMRMVSAAFGDFGKAMVAAATKWEEDRLRSRVPEYALEDNNRTTKLQRSLKALSQVLPSDPITKLRQRIAERQRRGQELAQQLRQRGGRHAGRKW